LDMRHSGVVIERKCVSDIVSRSGGWSAAHFKQERRLRFSGASHPMFLIEGDVRLAGRSGGAAVLVDSVEDLQGPDVIQSPQDLNYFLSCVIARSGCGRSVYCLQTENSSETAVLLSAFSVVMSSRLRETASRSDGFAGLSRVADLKFKATEWARQEGDLRDRLRGAGSPISRVFTEQVCRRFGTVSDLLGCYKRCSSDLHRSLLLTDVTMGETNLQHVLPKEMVGEAGDSSDPQEDHSMAYSEGVFTMVTSASLCTDLRPRPLLVGARVSHLTLSPSMADRMSNMKGFDSRIFTADMSPVMGGCSFTIRTVCHHDQVSRGSVRAHVAVISGLDLIEALVGVIDELLEDCIPEDLPGDYDIIARACDLLQSEYLPFQSETQSSSSSDIRVIIFENLLTRHGAVGKLKLVTSRARAGGAGGVPLSAVAPSSRPETSQSVALGIGRRAFSIRAAQMVEVKVLGYVYMCIAVLIMNYGNQCLICRNEDDTKDMLSALMNALHRESLLMR